MRKRIRLLLTLLPVAGIMLGWPRPPAKGAFVVGGFTNPRPGLLLIAGLMVSSLGACGSDGASDNHGDNRAPHHHMMGGEGPGSKH